MRTRLLLAIACGVALLGGCARKTPEVATVAPPPVLVPPPPPKPTPPRGAAPNLTIPVATPDGGYATLNRGLTTDAALWHLRAGLNVAVLQCNTGNPAGVDSYNRMLKAHAARFTAAFKALETQYRRGGGDWQDRFDDAMTRVYNYFAQPPVRDQFCATALPMLVQVADLPVGGVDGFAAAGIASLDQPFVDFYRAYDQYRVELAAWQAGQVPTLKVDPQILVASTDVTGGGYRMAAR